MGLGWTLALLAMGVVLTGLGRWQEARPRELGDVRLVPTTAIMAVGVLVTVLAAAHLVSLLTGVPFWGNYGP